MLPFCAVAVLLTLLKPLLAPIALPALAQAWIIPELYAARGAKALRPRAGGKEAAERTAAGLLGDLIDQAPRALYTRTGLVLERGRLGVWLLGEAGAMLVRPGGRRVHCYCVRTSDPELPSSDRIVHLLLALRADEAGFATLGNAAFCGARWRLRRRLSELHAEALTFAARAARSSAVMPAGPAAASATL